MVLVLKHWKSRSSPGIKAGGHVVINPFTISKAAAGYTRAAAFSSPASALVTRAPSKCAALRKADRPPELMRGKPSRQMSAPALEA